MPHSFLFEEGTWRVEGEHRDAGGGVLWPYVIQRERDGERIFEIYSESVQVNQGLTDELFTLSADMKVLPPSR